MSRIATMASDRTGRTPAHHPAVRLAQGATGLAALGTLVRAGQQDHLFVTSVFPAASPWLGLSIGVLGAVLLASAAMPSRCEEAG